VTTMMMIKTVNDHHHNHHQQQRRRYRKYTDRRTHPSSGENDWFLRRRRRGRRTVGGIDDSAEQRQEQFFAPMDSPEAILRVSKNTNFEGLKAAKRIAKELKKNSAEEIDRAFDEIVLKSVQFYERLYEEDPTNVEKTFAYANVLHTLEKFAEAIVLYERALQLSENAHVDSANNLAMILQTTERYRDLDKAEAYYLLALEADPLAVDVMFNWAQMKITERKDLESARVLINRIVSIEPKLKKHPLVRELSIIDDGDDDDNDNEPFVTPI
jgi:tetratricopeptide (TPR) repeat protein